MLSLAHDLCQRHSMNSQLVGSWKWVRFPLVETVPDCLFSPLAFNKSLLILMLDLYGNQENWLGTRSVLSSPFLAILSVLSFHCVGFPLAFSAQVYANTTEIKHSHMLPRPSLLTFAPQFSAHGLQHSITENWGLLESFLALCLLFLINSATPIPKGLLNCFLLFLIL